MTSNNVYSASGKLMEAVRKLDNKQQFKICETFYKMMLEKGFGDDSEMGQRFQDWLIPNIWRIR